jgi:hypothetical protein
MYKGYSCRRKRISSHNVANAASGQVCGGTKSDSDDFPAASPTCHSLITLLSFPIVLGTRFEEQIAIQDELVGFKLARKLVVPLSCKRNAGPTPVLTCDCPAIALRNSRERGSNPLAVQRRAIVLHQTVWPCRYSLTDKTAAGPRPRPRR